MKPYDQMMSVAREARPGSDRWATDGAAGHCRAVRPRVRRRQTVGRVPAAAQPVSDNVLIDGLRRGDPSAGDALVERYCPPLMRYLRRIAGAEAAEELHQQTWLSALDHLDGFATACPGGSFKAWLFRIATNKAKDRWRSGGRERDAKTALQLLAAPAAARVDQRMETAEQCDKLSRALGRLPEAQRQAIVLRYYTDLKFAEIADVLGCPLNTALTRVHKALIKLRQLMEHD